MANKETKLDVLETTNRLLILSLVRSGVQQKDIAATLEVSPSAMSKMFPKGVLKRIAQPRNTFKNNDVEEEG